MLEFKNAIKDVDTALGPCYFIVVSVLNVLIHHSNIGGSNDST